jgi:hypothetical protein
VYRSFVEKRAEQRPWTRSVGRPAAVAFTVLPVLLWGCARYEVEAVDAASDAASVVPPPAPLDASVIEREAGDPPDASDGGEPSDAAATARRVFITSFTYRGNAISASGGAPGSLGADVLCGRVAALAGLTGTFRAWLSDTNQAAAQHVPEPGPFYDVTRTRLVFTKNPAEAIPLIPIPDQNGNQLPGGDRGAWTGSTTAGLKLNDCDGWTASGAMGTGGDGNLPIQWASSGARACDTSRRLYCFEK